MAKVTIIIEDGEDGEVNVKTEFDPPLKRDEDETPAQTAGGMCLDAMMEQADSVEEDDDDYA